MSNNKWNWEELDEKLISLYKINPSNVRVFGGKYNIPLHTIYDRLKKLGIRDTHAKSMFKRRKTGHKYINKDGYVMIYIGVQKWIGEHTLVMEKHLGRKLTKNEVAHHIDESFEARSNNDISNLKLMTHSVHTKHHMRKLKKGGIHE